MLHASFNSKWGTEGVGVFLEGLRAVEIAEGWCYGQIEQSVVHLYAECWKCRDKLQENLGLSPSIQRIEIS